MVQVRDDPIIRAMERTGNFPWYSDEEERGFHRISHGFDVTASPPGEALGEDAKNARK